MTQKTCLLTIRPRSPLVVGDESGMGNYEQTADYIPGAVLRGAIGERLLEASCTQPDYVRDHASCPDQASCAFWRVFGAEHPPRFGHAYPATRGWGFPFPATARTCKYRPGYRDPRANPKGHGVFDVLTEQVVYDLVSDPCFPHRADLLPDLGDGWASLPAAHDPKCQHSECHGAVQPATGYYLLDGDMPSYTPHPTVSRATHVGINRARGVAEDALLYTLETIEARPGIQFRAQMSYDDAYADDLSTVLDLNGQIHTFYIGRGRSRGLGQVEVTAGLAPILPDLNERLDEPNYRVVKALKPYHEGDEQRIPDCFPGQFFSLTLRSAAILTAPDGTPALWPDLSPFKLDNAWPLRAWARTTLVGGWDAAADLPRTTRQAVEPGAVYLFYMPPGEMERQTLIDYLEKLELAGLGAGRERGYGQITACAPFHYAGWRE